MLIFQFKWEHIKDGCTRAGIDPKWLVHVVVEINVYLPDDWRMTRSENNFKIQVCGEHDPGLVGRSFRVEGNEILHVIDSVFLKGFYDKFDLVSATGPGKKRVDSRTKAQYPEIVTPNLYFFRPCPDDSASPLFARQYEKVKIRSGGKPSGMQFHRIHPLSKDGLDLTRFRWVRWNINGHVEPVTTLEPGFSDYHGKDFWEVPLLDSVNERARVERYMKDYKRILSEAGVRLAPNTEKAQQSYETEYKFLVPGGQEDVAAAYSLIEEAVKPAGFSIRSDSDKGAKKQVDFYFDDEHLSLYEAGASFRMREKKGNLRVTLKRKLPDPKPAPESGLYERIEEESVITAAQKKALMAGKKIDALPYRLLDYVVPRHGMLKSRICVSNNRRTLILEDEDHHLAELCLDKVTYEIEGRPYGPYFEIEIESKGASRDKVRMLARIIEENLGLTPSMQSKYERGVSLLTHGETLNRE